ncbi:MAG: hypothetical protein MI757_08630, partial [Pirellulales bacterium]|nr:hypothetical protein [Pirellulales bacterium]
MKDDARTEEPAQTDEAVMVSPESNGDQSAETQPEDTPFDPLAWPQDEALRDLVALAAERSKLEKKIHDEYTAKTEVVETDYKQSSSNAKKQYSESKSAALDQYNGSEKEIVGEYETDNNNNEQEYSAARNTAIGEYENAEEAA